MSTDPFAPADAAVDGALPPITDLINLTMAEGQKDFGSLLLAGLAPMVVTMVLLVPTIVFAYMFMFVGMIPGAVMDDELIMSVGLMVSMFGTFFIVLTLFAALTAPMTASLHRAVWALLTTGEKLTPTSAFATFTQDLGKVILYQIVMMAAVTAGAIFCYLPGLLVSAALTFAGPAIYIHRMPIGSAIGMSVSHMQKHPGWHLGVFGVTFLAMLALSNIPFIGPMLLMVLVPLFVLLAYRAAFGDGELPREV